LILELTAGRGRAFALPEMHPPCLPPCLRPGSQSANNKIIYQV